MHLQDSIVKSIESQIAAWQHELSEIKAEAQKEMAEADQARAAAEIKYQMAEQAEKIQRDIVHAQEKLKQVRAASSERLASLLKEFDKWLH